MNDQPAATATGSDSDPRRASHKASARLAPPRNSRCSATTATSFTGTMLAAIPAVPSGISELASTSSAPVGATTPESQA